MGNGNVENKVYLIYDKECPACDYYCSLVNIKKSVGQLQLVNARHSSEWMKKITEKGWDIDEGMVLVLRDNYYYATDAIHMLSLIGSDNGLFNKINYLLFKNKSIAQVLYPILRFFRSLLLKILGKSRINNLQQKSNDRF